MPDCVINRNAAASTRGEARGKHAGAQRNVYPGKHSTTKRAILCVVVLAQGIREHSVSSIQAMGRKAAVDRVEGGSILSKQGVV
jgi:hypothetical protein